MKARYYGWIPNKPKIRCPSFGQLSLAVIWADKQEAEACINKGEDTVYSNGKN